MWTRLGDDNCNDDLEVLSRRRCEQGSTALIDPRGLDRLPQARQKAAEGSLHKFSLFREHLTAALALGLQSGFGPHQFGDPLVAIPTAFWTLLRPGCKSEPLNFTMEVETGPGMQERQ